MMCVTEASEVVVVINQTKRSIQSDMNRLCKQTCSSDEKLEHKGLVLVDLLFWQGGS